MSEPYECSPSSTIKNDAVSVEILSKPSALIKCFAKKIRVIDTFYEMTLITMKRSFLLVINNVETGGFKMGPPGGDNITMSRQEVLESFLNENSSLMGLSLAINGQSTCLINSPNSVASLSLASRLSKTLNNGGPVYVANNMHVPEKLEEIYAEVFKFIRGIVQTQTIGEKSSPKIK